MSKPSLEGPRAKLDRARYHLDKLDESVQRFLNDKPYALVVEPDPDTGGELLRAKIPREGDDRFGPQIGDVVHNLRSGLDHAAFQLARLNRKQPNRSTGFPLCRSIESYATQGLPKIKEISKPAQILIETFQPYHATDETEMLGVLHYLWNTDKHRTLLVTAALFAHMTGHIKGPTRLGPIIAASQRYGMLKNGDVVLHLPPTVPPESKIEANLEAGFDIAFTEAGPATGQPVLVLLRDANDLIRDRLFPTFEQFFGQK